MPIMKLKVLNDDIEPSVENSGAHTGKFNNYLVNNNIITAKPREYMLEVEGLPYSFKGHKNHDEWIEFLKANPHIISNFDTRDPAKLSFLFDRWRMLGKPNKPSNW